MLTGVERMRKILPILIVGILLLSGVSIAAGSIEKTEYKEINLTFSKPEIKEQNNYITISIKEANSHLMKQNMPMLPSYTKTMIFPFGTKIKNVICTPENIEEKTITKEIMITPKPALAGKIIKTKSEETTNYKIYPENWYEYNVYSGLHGNVRSVFVNINIHPVKYNKQTKTIKWANKVEVKIEYTLPEPQPTPTDEKYNLVIISEDKYSNNLQNLVTHKTIRGISTKLVTLSEIYTGTYFPPQGRDHQENIKYFIKDAIEKWETSNIMLVGRNVPTRDVHVLVNDEDDEVFVSDLYYADIYDGKGHFASWDTNYNDVFGEISWGVTDDKLDLHPDVHLARIPCINQNELDNFVNKIINYENSYAYTQSWFGEIITVGGDSFTTDENGILEGEYVNDKVIDIMQGFIPTRIWASQGSLTTKATLTNALNSGAGFVDFSGHGNTYVWATHPYKNPSVWLPLPYGWLSTDTLGLSNREELPIIVTGACSVGKFNKDSNCYCYAWLKNRDGGGIASFGATGLGWAYIGEYVTYALIEKMTLEVFKAYKNGAITLGEMWSRALNSYIQDPGLQDEGDYKTVLEWECFGDPTLQIAEESQTPSTPERPNGPTSGETYEEYTYTTTSTDPDGDELYYLFDWGDGTYSGWIGPYTSGNTISVTNTWFTEGTYEIKVKAKDIHGTQSDWSEPLSVTMPRSKAVNHYTLLEKIWEQFPNIFPILKQLLKK